MDVEYSFLAAILFLFWIQVIPYSLRMLIISVAVNMKWNFVPVENSPSRRQAHCSAIMGNNLLISGGVSMLSVKGDLHSLDTSRLSGAVFFLAHSPFVCRYCTTFNSVGKSVLIGVGFVRTFEQPSI